jgi:mannosyltransferase OCH1-like enzyme
MNINYGMKKNINNLLDLYPTLKEYFHSVNFYNKINFGRYLILKHYGGVYCDIDSYPLKSIDEFLTNTNVLDKEDYYNTMNYQNKLFSEYDIIISLRNQPIFNKRTSPDIIMNNGILFSTPSDIWLECINFCKERTSLLDLIFEPYGIIGFNRFFNKYFKNKNGNILFLPYYYIENMKFDKNNQNQYFIYTLDNTWKNFI